MRSPSARILVLFVLLVFAAVALGGCKGHKSCVDLKTICDRCTDDVTKAECMDYVEHGTKDTCKVAAETYNETCKG